MITFSNIYKSYDNKHTYSLTNIKLDVIQGETLVLLGSSGSGKSTLLKLINRLIVPTAGEIYVDGINIKDYNSVDLRRSIGYVFQGVGLFPHMSVLENVSIVLKLLKEKPDYQIKKVESY